MSEKPDSPTCTFAGPGRGDCEHFIGLPGFSIPNQHDGPDITKDSYGKPNGWCWQCWKSYQIAKLHSALTVTRKALQRVWDEDECGWIVDQTDLKECVKCGAKVNQGERHTEECMQGFIDEALLETDKLI